MRRDLALRDTGRYETNTKMLISIKSIYVFIAQVFSGFSGRLNAVQLNTEIGTEFGNFLSKKRFQRLKICYLRAQPTRPICKS